MKSKKPKEVAEAKSDRMRHSPAKNARVLQQLERLMLEFTHDLRNNLNSIAMDVVSFPETAPPSDIQLCSDQFHRWQETIMTINKAAKSYRDLTTHISNLLS